MQQQVILLLFFMILTKKIGYCIIKEAISNMIKEVML